MPSLNKQITNGDAVLITGKGHGLKFSGRIGMVVRKASHTQYLIQFGSWGPFAKINEKSFRHAILQEVKDAGMYGIGFNIIDE